MAGGIVYILVNQAMPGYIKVGKTSTSVSQRIKELDTTPVPLPFECFFAAQVDDMDLVEKKIHEAFADHRVRKNREFFSIGPERVKAILDLVSKGDASPKEDVVQTVEDQSALNDARKRRSNFRFDLVGIASGAELVSVFDDSITCTVGDSRRVNFRNEKMSISEAALTVAREKGRTWATINGPQYWKCNGKTLDELRDEIESQPVEMVEQSA